MNERSLLARVNRLEVGSKWLASTVARAADSVVVSKLLVAGRLLCVGINWSLAFT